MLNEFDLKDFDILQNKPVRFVDEGNMFEYMLDVFEVIRNNVWDSHVECVDLRTGRGCFFRADEYVSPLQRKTK